MRRQATAPQEEVVSEDLDLQAIIREHGCPVGWEKVFEANGPVTGTTTTLDDISENIRRAAKKKSFRYAPKGNAIFSSFCIPPSSVSVVIIGEAPYPDANVACGIAFSTPGVVDKRRSNYVLYEECRSCYPELPLMKDGDLMPWVKQGVLLLNTSLTVNLANSKTFLSVYMPIIDRIILELNEHPNVIWCLYGVHAAKLRDRIKSKHILEAGHPSKLNRNNNFSGCGHPKMINTLLAQFGRPEINWSLG